MTSPSQHRRAKGVFAALAAVPLVAAGALAASGASASASTAKPPASSFKDGRYVVITKDDGATTYSGTRAAKGQRFDASKSTVKAYKGYLTGKQNRIAASVGAKATRNFTVAVSGFSAELTAKQATKLAADKDVLLVQKDERRQLDTWHTPTLLGLTGTKGVWNSVGGVSKAGDGVVVGVIDSGIWPESASFAGSPLTIYPQGKWGLNKVGDVISMKKADGGTFTGACETGQEFTAADCNSKLITARYYPDSYIANVPEAERPETEYLSPRDGGGHGSHTASTAAGNNGVPMSVDGRYFGKGSGMAPAAKIAAYKVCFDDGDPATGDCYGSSSIAAIDDAITDGVDVINYSISGAQTTVIDAVEFAFEGAAEAGVFVATSAGNSGPTASTVAHNSPWLTTVAASTAYNFENTVVLGDGTKIKGASITDQTLPQTPLVNSENAVASGSTAPVARLCGPDSLDPALVTGKIVACVRGTYDRVAKSAEVKRAGGVGMILVNVTPNSLDADFHSVPTIHVSDTAASTVFGYIAGTASPTAAFEKGDTTGGPATPLPQVAAFSSRGPARANNSDLLKPDISAPGVSILAAVAPPTNSGRDFDLYSGTSMASPHIAGLAAVFFGKYPNWSPMAVKSAMMTTSLKTMTADGATSTDAFAQGAGQVTPRRFFDPGLVIDSGAEDFRGFITGQGLDTGVPAISPTDFNGPSIANSQVAGSFTTTRTFTSLKAGRWVVQFDVPGFTSTHPKVVKTTAAGQTRKVTFTFKRTTAPLDTWVQGNIRLEGTTTLRLPVAFKAVALAAPTEVDAEQADGSTSFTVTPGASQTLTTTVNGLAAGDSTEDSISTGEAHQVPVTVPAGTSLTRIDLDAANDSTDLDLFLYTSGGTLVGQSATGSADEQINLSGLPAGNYIALVDGYDTGGSAVNYRLDAYNVPASDAGNLTVAPSPVTARQGVPLTLTASWTGLDPTKRYLGYLTYSGSTARTIVNVR